MPTGEEIMRLLHTNEELTIVMASGDRYKTKRVSIVDGGLHVSDAVLERETAREKTSSPNISAFLANEYIAEVIARQAPPKVNVDTLRAMLE